MHVLFRWSWPHPVSVSALGLVKLGFWTALLLLAALAAPRAAGQLLPNSTTVRGAAQASHYFGDSVAIDGDTMVAGTSSNKTVYVFRRGASGWALESQFVADYPNTVQGDVRLSGDTLIVGNAVYVRSGTTWTKQFSLPVGSGIGHAMAIKGDRIVVGDPNDGYDGSNWLSADGAVHVFVRNAGAWSLEAKLTPDVPRNEAIGYSVAFDGTTLVATPDAFRAGELGTYVFVREGGTWRQQARFLPPSGGRVGWSCAVEGDWLAVNDPDQEFVYLLRRTGENWNLAQTLGASDADRNHFGSELYLRNGHLAVMAERVRTYPNYQTTLACYFFVQTSSGWVQAQRMDRAGGAVWGSLAFTDRAVVLGDGSDSTVASYGGSATIYEVPPPPAPGSGWQGLDIGAVGLAGSSSGGAPTASVTGSGADIWGTSDAFHYRTETMTGDGAVIARVTGLTNTDGFAKAGIMFREDISPSAREVMMVATPANNITFQYRTDRASPTQFVHGAYGVPSAWLKLERAGNVFTGYRSNDGTNWLNVGSVSLALPATIHIGLAVTSHNNSALATGTFDNVQWLTGSTPPPPPPPPPSSGWTGTDVGAVGIAGAHTFGGESGQVQGSGADIWGSADAFRFVHRTLSGDGTLVVHVASLQNTHGWAKAGLMLREGTAPGARNVMILTRPDRTIAFQSRTATGGTTTNVMGSWNLASVWLMLARTGNTFDGYESTDGTNWRKVGSVTMTLPAELLAGLAVTSHDNSQLAAASFDNFELVTSSAPPPPPPPPAGDWQTAKIGDGLEGGYSVSSGVFTVSGSGSDIWSTSDNFRFVYRTLAGDGELVARVASFPTTASTHPVAKVGVMIRDSVAANAAFGHAFITPRDLVAVETRATTGASAARTATLYDRFVPQWLRLVRQGNAVTFSASSNGTTWTELGTQTLALGSSALVGLVVCAHDASRLETATFDQVALTPASGGGTNPPGGTTVWTAAPIGNPASSSATIGAAAISATVASSDIWGTADSFGFVYQPWSGDGEIVTRVDGLTNTHSWAKAGVMFRQSLAPGAANAFVFLTPSVGAVFQHRATDGGSSATATHSWGPSAPYWLRLVRSGNVFSAYASANGTTWTALGSQTIAMGAQIYVGFAVTSHTTAASTTANFSQFVVR
jgi:regulation of enolase protein 1 (concanavalin A-like superfamily)